MGLVWWGYPTVAGLSFPVAIFKYIYDCHMIITYHYKHDTSA